MAKKIIKKKKGAKPEEAKQGKAKTKADPESKTKKKKAPPKEVVGVGKAKGIKKTCYHRSIVLH